LGVGHRDTVMARRKEEGLRHGLGAAKGLESVAV